MTPSDLLAAIDPEHPAVAARRFDPPDPIYPYPKEAA